MKSSLKYFAVTALVTGVAFQVPAADDVREVVILEDTAPNKMTTKVYDLKYTIAADLAPYVHNAVNQIDTESRVDRVDFKAEGKQLLIVSMWDEVVPMIDDLVAKLDRPGFIDNGSYDFVYYPKYRDVSNLSQLFDSMYQFGEGKYYEDEGWVMRWKDSKSDGSGAMKVLKHLDKPIPQANLTFTVYEINENDLKEVGVDYASWMNGPGQTLFQYQNTFSSGDDATAIHNDGTSFLPSFDFSFVRLLQQKGVAKVATTAYLTLKNAAPTATLSFDPNLQSINKGGNFHTVGTATPGLDLSVSNSTFFLNENQTGAGHLIFDWSIELDSIVETTASGVVMNSQKLNSTEEMMAGGEKVLVAFNREHDVEQFVGVPFLSEIPYIKYLFGTETTSKAKSTVIVTVKADNVSGAAKTYTNAKAAALLK